MNIAKRELKANAKALIVWCISLILIVASGMAKFSGLASSGQDLSAIFAKMPRGMQFLMGGPGINFGTAEGYYAVLFMYVLLMGAIYAVLLGSGILAKEERDKTVEFLIPKPVSRTAVVFEKLLVVVINMVIFCLVLFVSSIIALNMFKVSSQMVSHIAVFALSLFLVQLIFVSVGALLASVFKDAHRSGSGAIIVLMVTYFIGIAEQMTDGATYLRVLSPFIYFPSADILSGKGLPIAYVVLGIVILVACFVGAFRAYNKRDLTV